MNKKKIVISVMTIAVIGLIIYTFMTPVDMSALDNYTSSVYGQVWSLLPPALAIILALITKEVYTSLLTGIITGALLYSGFNLELMINTMFFNENGGMTAKLSSISNIGILLFLVMLGILVALMNKAGGSAAFGRWAAEHIKTRIGAQLATMMLGIVIFVDDYFNCLTVGSVMKPVTDTHKVSRAKLSYIIDSTAAPVCIIAPISSWAAAVTSSVPDDSEINGFTTFLKTIPYNFYAILTILMMIAMVVMKVEYGPMKVHEDNAKKGDIYTTPDRPYANTEEEAVDNCKGKVMDLLIPIISLIICCVIGMIYTGGFFDGVGFVEAFSGSDASQGLVYGSFFAFVITIVLYLVRRVLKFDECMACLPDGFKAMVPAILILVFAWTLKSMTDSLGAAEYVAGIVAGSAEGMVNLLPAIIFLVGCFLAFATGTSWGTFGILIPIVVHAFEGKNETMMIIAISACMAGAVCGDHCSPISDTTIMASAGAQCNHINHVNTQLPYAASCAAISFITYIIAGFVQSAWIALPAGIIMMLVFVTFMKFSQKEQTTAFSQKKEA